MEYDCNCKVSYFYHQSYPQILINIIHEAFVKLSIKYFFFTFPRKFQLANFLLFYLFFCLTKVTKVHKNFILSVRNFKVYGLGTALIRKMNGVAVVEPAAAAPGGV